MTRYPAGFGAAQRRYENAEPSDERITCSECGGEYPWPEDVRTEDDVWGWCCQSCKRFRDHDDELRRMSEDFAERLAGQS